MKIIIDYNQDTNTFSVQFDRGSFAKTDGDWPPPPPWANQIQEMTDWLNKVYPDCTQKFRDHEVSALQLSFTPSPGKV